MKQLKNLEKRELKVLAGGYHPTVEPEECLENFDSIIIGNAEMFWLKNVRGLQK